MLGSCDGNIHSSIVAHETEALVFVWSNTWEDDNVFLTTLESIHSINLEVLLWAINLKIVSDKLEQLLF